MAHTQGGTIVLGVAERPIGLVWVSSNLLRDDDVRTGGVVTGNWLAKKYCRNSQ